MSAETRRRKISWLMTALCVAAASAVMAQPLRIGQRVYAVVVRGTEKAVESGRVTGLRERMSRVRWDECACETRVPVENLFVSQAEADEVGARLGTDRISFNEAAGSAGRMSLLYLLLSRTARR